MSIKFKNVTSGNWSDVAIWESFDGSNWIPASSSPNSSHDVYIESATTVTLDVNAECGSLWLNNELNVTRLNLSDKVLKINGKLNLFSGPANNPGPVDNTAPPDNPTIFLIIGSGKIVFVGTEDREIIENKKVNAGRILAGWNMEIDFSYGKKAVINDRFRAGTLTVKSGILEITPANNPFRVDMDGKKDPINPSGSILIKSGAKIKARHLERATGMPMSSFTLEDNSEWLINYSDPRLAAVTIQLSGTVVLEEPMNQNFPGNSNYTGASKIDTFQNLKIAGSGEKKLLNDITINGTLEVVEPAVINKNGFQINYGSNSKLTVNIKPFII